MKKIKNIIIVALIIVLIVIGYFVVTKYFSKTNREDEIFSSFESGLTGLGITYTRSDVDASEYGAKKAYSYVANEKTIILYIFDSNSEEYKQGELNNFIQSKKNEESKLYGVFRNNCVLYMESEFPNDSEVLTLFINVVTENK